jgi:hypothetical protein
LLIPDKLSLIFKRKNKMANILDRLTLGEGWLLRVDADPSAGVGTPAPIGSYAQWEDNTNPSDVKGRQYIKVGAADNAWDEMATHAYVMSREASIRSDFAAADAAELARALAAEAALQAEINAEEARALAAEAAIRSEFASADAAIISDLDDLDAYAQEIRSDLDQEVLDRITDVNAEETRALAAEAFLQSEIDAEETLRASEDFRILNESKQYTDSSISNLIDAAPEAYDTLREIAEYIASDQTATSQILSQLYDHETRLDVIEGTGEGSIAKAEADAMAYTDAEKARAMAAEAALQAEIDAEEARAMAAEAAELARALAAEAEIRSDLDDLDAYAQEIRSDLDDLDAYAQEIRSDLDQEVLDRIADVNAEETRAMAREAELQAEIDAEETRAMAREAELQAEIDAEEVARAEEDLTFLKLDGSRAMEGALDLDHNQLLNVAELQLKATSDESNPYGSISGSVADGLSLSSTSGMSIESGTGEISVSDGKIKNLADGVNAKDAVNKGQLDFEVNRLDDRIDNVLENIDPAALDSLKEVVDAFQNADSDIYSAINSLSVGLSEEIDEESNRAKAREDELEQMIEDESLTRAAADLTFVKTDGSRPMSSLEVTGNLTITGSGSEFSLFADSEFKVAQSKTSTLDASVTTLQSFAVPLNSMVHVRSTIIAKKKTGPGIGDGAVYVREARFKNINGIVTMHTLQSSYTSEDVVGLNTVMDASGTEARVRVTGLSSTEIEWESTSEVTVL